MKELKAILVTTLMIAVSFMALPWGAPHVKADTVTTFAAGGQTTTLAFASGAGSVQTVEVAVPAGGKVLSATMNVSGLPHTAGGKDYPKDIAIDVGADGDTQWAWNGTRNGALGYQSTLSDGSSQANYQFTQAGVDTTKGITLPSGAKVTKAAMEAYNGEAGHFEPTAYYGAEYDVMGYYVQAAGDVNKDGLQDFIATGPHSHYGEWSNGHVMVILGTATPDGKASVDLYGPTEDERFGYWAAGAGDVNHDGYADIIVGSPDWSNSTDYELGSAYIYYGGAKMDGTVDVVIHGQHAYDHLGSCVDGIGDINHDGYDDVIVGAPGVDAIGSDLGEAFIYYGGSPMNNVSDLVIAGEGDDWELGTVVAGVGDVNKDGYKDIIIGAPGYDNGAVFLYFGGTTFDTTADLTIKPSDADWYFGTYAAGVGDLNGDGCSDIAVMNNENEAWIYFGGKPMDTMRDVKLVAEHDYDEFGYAMASAGDLNKDGYGDLLIGAFGYNASLLYGKTYLYWGGKDFRDVPAMNWTGANEGDRLGIAVAGIGDFNGDGFGDIVLGENGVAHGDKQFSGAALLELWVMGIKDPEVRLKETSARLWNYTGYFKGNGPMADMSASLNSALPSVGTSFKDGYGNKFTNITFNVSAKRAGPFALRNIGVSYDLNASMPDFAAEITEYLAGHQPDQSGLVKVPIKVTVTPGGDVKLSGLKIVVDMPPTATVPTGLRLAEGSVNNTFLDLYTVFKDDIDPPQDLTLSIINATNDSYVKSTVSGGHWLALDASTGSADVNWTGWVYLRLTAKDKGGQTSKVAILAVEVYNMPDAPVFTSAPLLEASAGKAFVYTAKAVDGDKDQTVTYSITGSVKKGLSIDPTTGVVTWKPKPTDPKTVSIDIVASDGNLTAHQVFAVKVKGGGQSGGLFGSSMGLLLILVLVIVIVLVVVAVVAMRMKKAKTVPPVPAPVAPPEPVIEDVFLIYGDGRLISHHTRRLKPETDEHSLSAMLTAIQSFVHDSMPTEGELQKPIQEISFGENKILMSHGKYVYIASVIQGAGSEVLLARMGNSLQRIELEFGAKLEKWDGDLRDLEGAKLVMRELLHGPGAPGEGGVQAPPTGP